MLLRCFRVDRIYRGVTEYVTKVRYSVKFIRFLSYITMTAYGWNCMIKFPFGTEILVLFNGAFTLADTETDIVTNIELFGGVHSAQRRKPIQIGFPLGSVLIYLFLCLSRCRAVWTYHKCVGNSWWNETSFDWFWMIRWFSSLCR